MSEISNQQIIDRYLKRFSHSKPSQSMRKYCLRYFFSPIYYGYDKHIFKIKKRDTLNYFDYLNQLNTISLQTKKNKWNIFRSFLQFIMEYYDDFVIIIPRYSIQWKPIHKKPYSNKDVVMTKEEVNKILSYSYKNNYYFYLILRLLAETGMRIGELLSINSGHLNIKKRSVETIGKTGENIYYYSKGLANHLKIYLKERMCYSIDTKKLFLSINKQRLTQRSINRYIRYVVTHLNIDKYITAHTFRKTLNTLRKRMGCHTEDRKILLCHKVVDINFDYYVKLNYNDLIQLYDKWNPYN